MSLISHYKLDTMTGIWKMILTSFSLLLSWRARQVVSVAGGADASNSEEFHQIITVLELICDVNGVTKVPLALLPILDRREVNDLAYLSGPFACRCWLATESICVSNCCLFVLYFGWFLPGLIWFKRNPLTSRSIHNLCPSLCPAISQSEGALVVCLLWLFALLSSK